MQIQAVRQHGLIHRQIRRHVDVCGPVVTIHAVHTVGLGLGNLLFAQGRVLGHVFGETPLLVFHADVGNHLALVVAGDVVDLIGNVHVPVNAFGSAGGGIAAAGFNQHTNLAGRVLLVA